MAEPPGGIAELGAAIRELDGALRPQIEEIKVLKAQIARLDRQVETGRGPELEQASFGYEDTALASPPPEDSTAEEIMRLEAELGIKQDKLKADYAARQQALAHRLGQRRRTGDVETQFHRGGDLVDVLAAGATGADEAFDDFAFGDLDAHGPRDMSLRLESAFQPDRDAAMSHRILLAALIALCAAFPAHAQGEPADDTRIDRLLEVTRARQMLDAMLPQIEASQRQMVAQMTGGRELDAAQQQRLDAILASSATTVRKTLAWENLEPVYRDIYRQTFTGEDVDAIVAFYESPAGQRMLDRMPELMQNTMAAMQRLVVPMLQQMERDLAAEIPPAD